MLLRAGKKKINCLALHFYFSGELMRVDLKMWKPGTRVFGRGLVEDSLRYRFELIFPYFHEGRRHCRWI